VFVPCLSSPDPSDGPALVVAVRSAQVALHQIEGHHGGVFLGTLAGRHCWAVDTDEGDDLGAEVAYADLFGLWGTVDELT